MRGPFYPGTEGSLAFHTQMVADAAERGELLALDDRAFVAHWVEERFPHRHLVMVHRRRDDPEALAWCRTTLDAVVDQVGDDLEVELLGNEVALRQHLLARGDLGINAVVQAGRVEHARRNLGEVPALPEGIQLRPQQPSDVDALIELRREVFRKEPEYFWFGASDAFVERSREMILRNAEEEHGWVLVRAGRVVGQFEYTAYNPCVHYGTSAGLGLMLAEDLRGRGLSKLAYRTVLDSMAAEGIVWFKGTTARKGVLHLGRRMGRGVTAVWFRRNHTFPPGWFGLEGGG